jgi:hypothetical protein
MTYDYLKALKSSKSALRLIGSEHFAMILSWIYALFVARNRRRVEHGEVLQSLEEHLYDLNGRYDNPFPQTAKHYLDRFVRVEYGYLRRYYENEELFYEPTPDTYRVLEFVESLQRREFVGSGTKFSLIFELLQKLEYEALMDSSERLKAIDAQIERLEAERELIGSGEGEATDETQIREIVAEVITLSRRLLYDFSDIEYNFRALNRETKEKIAGSFAAKSEVLDFVFDSEEAIRNSDQGKSFFAFWELLTSEKNEKLEELGEKLYEIEAVAEADRDRRLANFKYDLVLSAHQVQIVVNRLIEQLRRFIDERAWLENRRVLELVGSIEKRALAMRELPKEREFMSVARPGIELALPLGRHMYEVREEGSFRAELKKQRVDIDIRDALFDRYWVDETQLHRNIVELLQHHSQISLKEIVDVYPVRKGVAEIVGYLSLATTLSIGYINESAKEELEVEDVDGGELLVRVPKILFIRERKGSIF